MSLRNDDHLERLAQTIQRLQRSGNETALQEIMDRHDPGTVREAMATLRQLETKNKIPGRTNRK